MVTDDLAQLPAGRRLMVMFARPLPAVSEVAAWIAELLEDGFVRAVIGSQVVSLQDERPP